MSTGILCRQHGCTAHAAFRYTWPGKDESAICAEHLPALLASVAQAKARRLRSREAGAIGLHVIPISAEEHAKSRLDSEGP